MASVKKQSGAVLLIFMLVLITGASYTLLSKLSAATKIHSRQLVTSRALAEAKQALISYAVTFPERSGTVDLTAGPGYMSCPDTNNNGSPNTPCGPSVVGRFPGEFWGVNSYLDSSGQRLWYAVSANFRNIGTKFKPMNSDTPGQLNVDGIIDIVAVIIAPGEPVAGQTNRPSNNVADYLEGDNATTGDNSFTLNSGGNDVLVYITRQELMAVVEKRVLGDVEGMINNYQTSHNAFPWLSPFVDPSTTVFRGVPTTLQGHIPLHWANDPDSIVIGTGDNIAGRNPFSTNIAVTWDNITNADSTTTNSWSFFGFNTVSDACLNDINDCDEGGIFPEITSLSPAARIDCTWSDKDTADCVSFSVTINPVAIKSGACPPGVLTRTYTITYPSFAGVSNINNPSASVNRTRDVSLVAVDPDFIPAQVNAIQISDSYTGFLGAFGFCLLGPITAIVGTGSSTFDADTEGTIAINNIHYDIDIDDGELPEWFVENDWQNLIYLAYASGEPLPGDTTAGQDCISLATSCITVTNPNGSVTNVRSAVLSAGVTLTGQDRGITPDEDDFFDDVENTNLDDTLLKNTLTTTYNDQTRIISTAP